MTYSPVCELAELGELPLATTVGESDLVLVKLGGEVFCLADECSHGAVALSEGDIDPRTCSLECYLHGSRFDLRTGRPLNFPATEPVACYPVKIDGDHVLVDTENPIVLEEN